MQSIGHDLRRGLNNINPLGNNYKTITKWLAEMKNIDSSLKTLDKEISADAKLIAAWGSAEGDDLTDVTLRMSQLMEEVGLIQQAYSLRHTQYRKTIKSMKVQEMTLDENRKKKQDLTSQIAKLQKSNKENPIKMMELQNGLERVTAELLGQELELMQFKRVTIKQAFDARFDAMLEYSEKMALIAGYGRAITLVIDTDTQVADRMRIYNGAEYTAAAVNQVKSAVSSWQPQPMETSTKANNEFSQDELALAAAAAAYNNTTPRMSGAYATSVTHDQAGSSNFQEVEPEQGYGSSSKSREDQISRIKEQERQLEQEQQRLYQQSLTSYSPVHSPRQQEYEAAGVGGGSTAPAYTSSMPRRSDTQDFYSPPPQSGYDTVTSSSPGYSGAGGAGGYPQPGYGHYDASTYQSVAGQAPPRNYRLGFIDPRERSQMENGEVYKAEIRQGGGPAIPPLQFTNSPILDEK